MINSTIPMHFPEVSGKTVVCQFDGGEITSDAGILLVAAADRRVGLTKVMSDAIKDRRDSDSVKHDMVSLLRERIYAISAGHEDANDLQTLRADPALKTACGRAPKSGESLAGQSTVSRMENAVTDRDLVRMSIGLARSVVEQLPSDTTSVILDVDATDDPCHGQQEFQFFNAHYDAHCYLPLLLFVTAADGRQWPLAAMLRPGNSASTKGLRGLIKTAVSVLRERFPDIRIILRADGGFGCDKVLRLCDRLKVHYLLGLPSNRRLEVISTPIQMDVCLKQTATRHNADRPVCREYGEFLYKAHSWDKKRRVIIKAEISEITRGGRRDSKVNPRYIVTNDPSLDPENLYALYCGRGDAENRIKEFKNDLCGDRTSCHRFLANQCRLLLHLASAVLMTVLRAAAASTSLATAQASTLRAKILKVGARVVESVRRICFHLSSSFPHQSLWRQLHQELAVPT